jgi:hypothetical protein
VRAVLLDVAGEPPASDHDFEVGDRQSCV